MFIVYYITTRRWLFMKKLIFLSLVVLMLASSVFAECTDTDDGENYGVKGTTTFTKGGNVISENTDLCKDEGTLIEYFCDESGKTSLNYFICECVDGACVGMEEAVEEEVPEEEEEEEIIEEDIFVAEDPVIEEPKVTKSKIYCGAIVIAVLGVLIIAAAVFWKKREK